MEISKGAEIPSFYTLNVFHLIILPTAIIFLVDTVRLEKCLNKRQSETYVLVDPCKVWQQLLLQYS